MESNTERWSEFHQIFESMLFLAEFFYTSGFFDTDSNALLWLSRKNGFDALIQIRRNTT